MPVLGKTYVIGGSRWHCACVGMTFCTLVNERGRRWYVPLRDWMRRLAA